MFIETLNFIWITKQLIPLHYRALLDHEEPTTLRLEALSLYHQEMQIKILEESSSDKSYKREIIMFGGEDNIPRELAHIQVFLESLPQETIRREIIEKKRPFGRVLKDAEIETLRKEMAFFKIYKDERISKHLADPSSIYYGRKYSIWLSAEDKKLADVIEIYSRASAQIK